MKAENEFLNLQRHLADPESDALVRKYFHAGREKGLYSILQLPFEHLADTDDSEIKSFLYSRKDYPEWYSEQRIRRGQLVFEHYASEIMTLLGVMALPYCYAGTPGNKALYLSEKMRKSPGKRLSDTADFVISVSTPGNLTENDLGHYFINKTRLVHSIARYHTAKSNWDHDAWGMPINQEDMAGTNLAFSYIIINGIKRSGFTLTERQREDFTHLWRYIGYQMGIHEELLPATFREAFRLTNLIKFRNFKNSREGEELTQELLEYYRSVDPADKAQFIDSQVRYYLGSKVSGFIGIKPEVLKDRVTEFVNTFAELQNSFSQHKSSYGDMIRNYQMMKEQIQAESLDSK